uniref:Uncharacterized protein n=1 Tax=Zonotrichia albicollis TaxID=44394 RepID=A0A8D2M1Q2_ZONAL
NLQAQKPLWRLNISASLIFSRKAACTLTYVMTLHKGFETFGLFFRELFMLQNVYHVHVDVIQGAISLPAGSADFLTCLAFTMPWCYLLSSCGQDHPAAEEPWGQGHHTQGAATSPHHHLHQIRAQGAILLYVHLTTCFGSVSVAITWLFVEFLLQDQCVLHLLAWPKDTNSPEGHFWVMPCRILGEHDFFHLFFL